MAAGRGGEGDGVAAARAGRRAAGSAQGRTEGESSGHLQGFWQRFKEVCLTHAHAVIDILRLAVFHSAAAALCLTIIILPSSSLPELLQG